MFCLGKFVIYISCAWVMLPLHICYIWFCINMYLNSIPVSELTRFIFILYNIIISFTSYWLFCSISLLWMSYYTTALLLNMHLFSSICAYYTNFYSDIFVYFTWYTPWLYYVLGNHLVVYISWFIIPLLPSSLTCINNYGLTHTCLDLPLFWHMHWITYINSNFLDISYIYLSFRVFCYLLLLGQIFAFNPQHSKTCNQHHIYTIFDKVSIFHVLSLDICVSNARH